MKNKTGKIVGFVLGLAGFLFLFKVLVLPNIPPEDEIAPGAVLMVAILSGVFFAFVGHFIQKNYFRQKSV